MLGEGRYDLRRRLVPPEHTQVKKHCVLFGGYIGWMYRIYPSWLSRFVNYIMCRLELLTAWMRGKVLMDT